MTQRHKVCSGCGYVGKPSVQLMTLRRLKCPKCAMVPMSDLRSEVGQTVLAQGRDQPRLWSDTLTSP